MTTKHHIKEDLYTNSLLISPNPEEEEVTEFCWVRKNPHFSSSKEKKPIHVANQLYYQCTIFDYKSTIQLVITRKSGSIITYAFGPIQLQVDLYPYLKDLEVNFSLKTIFNKRQGIQTNASIKNEDKNVILNLQLGNENRFSFNFPHCQQQHDYEVLFRIEEHSSNKVDLNFFKDKKGIVQILKRLKIYSYQGNFFTIELKNQLQRDVFLLNILISAGFIIQPEYKIKSKPKHLISQIKTQASHNKEASNQGEGFISSNPKFNRQNEIDLFCSPTREGGKKESGSSRNIEEFSQNWVRKEPEQSSYEKQRMKKKEIEKMQATRRRKSYAPLRQNEEEELAMFIIQKKKLQENNKFLSEQNKHLKGEIDKRLKKKEQMSKNIPPNNQILIQPIQLKKVDQSTQQRVVSRDKQKLKKPLEIGNVKSLSHLPKYPIYPKSPINNPPKEIKVNFAKPWQKGE